ncbi:MAG: hypothetical protein ACT4OY_09200 [Alphaproteobacteria bacterium]
MANFLVEITGKIEAEYFRRPEDYKDFAKNYRSALQQVFGDSVQVGELQESGNDQRCSFKIRLEGNDVERIADMLGDGEEMDLAGLTPRWHTSRGSTYNSETNILVIYL